MSFKATDTTEATMSHQEGQEELGKANEMMKSTVHSTFTEGEDSAADVAPPILKIPRLSRNYWCEKMTATPPPPPPPSNPSANVGK